MWGPMGVPQVLQLPPLLPLLIKDDHIQNYSNYCDIQVLHVHSAKLGTKTYSHTHKGDGDEQQPQGTSSHNRKAKSISTKRTSKSRKIGVNSFLISPLVLEL